MGIQSRITAPRRGFVLGIAVLSVLALNFGAVKTPASLRSAERPAVEHGAPRTWTVADARSLQAAEQRALELPRTGGRWQQVTDLPLSGESKGYPTYESGGGERDVSGSVTAIATQGSGTIYAGTEDGGVWKSTDGGEDWTPVFDFEPTLSVGAIAIDPADHSVWVATGSSVDDAFPGMGVFRSGDGGRNWRRVGGSELTGLDSYRIAFDSDSVFVATTGGLWRRSTAGFTSPWKVVLKPDPNPDHNPYRTSYISDVAVRPGTSGRVVVAVDGWAGWGGTSTTKYNGFYESDSYGRAGTFHRVLLSGSLDQQDIGRTAIAYSVSGGRLYAIVESPVLLQEGAPTDLLGIFVSRNGSLAGPWSEVASPEKLCLSGSYFNCRPGGTGYPGWLSAYNDFIVVDPHDQNRLFAGVSEAWESTDGGKTFTTISRYYLYGLPCYKTNTCPAQTHVDQHAAVIGSNGELYIGNDGGIYRRPVSWSGLGDWTDLNDRLYALEYYSAGAARVPGGIAWWGGMQDNGTAVVYPGHAKSDTALGGDGASVLVDPGDGNRALMEYAGGDIMLTTDGGHALRTISPLCAVRNAQPCDQNLPWVTPLAADMSDPSRWLLGGRYVWEDTKAWSTVCDKTSCDWQPVHDLGSGYTVTALAADHGVIYAAWACNTCSAQFGIDTFTGGSWHRFIATKAGLPAEPITSLAVREGYPSQVYVTYNGHPGVYETSDGGSSWMSISGNLPQLPDEWVTSAAGRLYLATTSGVYVTTTVNGDGNGVRWYRLGAGLPNALVRQLQVVPGTDRLLATTYGRGLWTITLPSAWLRAS
jgi:hypothetical protein